jgi:hypothetical protein
MSEVILNAGDLTDEQLKVVECDHKIVLCAACPGSGKTTTLRARALRLWETYQQPLLIVTFSKLLSIFLRTSSAALLLKVTISKGCWYVSHNLKARALSVVVLPDPGHAAHKTILWSHSTTFNCSSVKSPALRMTSLIGYVLRRALTILDGSLFVKFRA